MTAESTQVFVELVQRQHDCLRQLRDLGHRQLELIAAGKIDELLELLTTKQQWLEAFQRIVRELKPFGDQPPEHRPWDDPAQREHCQRLLEECRVMYQEITQAEQTSETNLCQQRDGIGQQLQQTHSAHQAHTAYVGGLEHVGGPTGGQLDLSTEG